MTTSIKFEKGRVTLSDNTPIPISQFGIDKSISKQARHQAKNSDVKKQNLRFCFSQSDSVILNHIFSCQSFRITKTEFGTSEGESIVVGEPDTTIDYFN